MSIVEMSAAGLGVGMAALALASAITPDNTTAIAGAAVLVIGAVAAAAVAIIRALRETKQTVVTTAAQTAAQTAAINTRQDEKLAGIQEDTKTIVFVTDGNYTKLLQQVANIQETLASTTGRKSDMDNAIHAQARADQHAELSADAKAAAAAAVPAPTRGEEGR